MFGSSPDFVHGKLMENSIILPYVNTYCCSSMFCRFTLCIPLVTPGARPVTVGWPYGQEKICTWFEPV